MTTKVLGQEMSPSVKNSRPKNPVVVGVFGIFSKVMTTKVLGQGCYRQLVKLIPQEPSYSGGFRDFLKVITKRYGIYIEKLVRGSVKN